MPIGRWVCRDFDGPASSTTVVSRPASRGDASVGSDASLASTESVPESTPAPPVPVIALPAPPPVAALPAVPVWAGDGSSAELQPTIIKAVRNVHVWRMGCTLTCSFEVVEWGPFEARSPKFSFRRTTSPDVRPFSRVQFLRYRRYA